jgi:hypothetical protein
MCAADVAAVAACEGDDAVQGNLSRSSQVNMSAVSGVGAKIHYHSTVVGNGQRCCSDCFVISCGRG